VTGQMVGTGGPLILEGEHQIIGTGLPSQQLTPPPPGVQRLEMYYYVSCKNRKKILKGLLNFDCSNETKGV